MSNEYDYSVFPLAYLITFRCYGSWLHGDKRGAVDRHGYNIYGTPRRATNSKLEKLMRQELIKQPRRLSATQVDAIEGAIEAVCQRRGYVLRAINARSNHIHAVVSALGKPEPILSAFKCYATRKLRQRRLIGADKPWARRGSKRYLWKPLHVDLAIDYVLYGQGDEMPEFEV